MRMDPFNYIQNRMNQLWREFDRDFAPMMQRFGGSEQNVPLIAAGPGSLTTSPSSALALNQPFASSAWMPSIRLDVRETPQEIVVAADLPGVPKESIHASVDENGLLNIRAEKKQERVENEPSGQWTWRERHSGVVQRTVQLPAAVDAGSAAHAEFKDGVLQMKFNKRPERAGQAIQIQ